MSWQAENGRTTPAAPASPTFSKTSFDRPYASGYGSAGFLPNDAGIIQLAERTGRRIGFVTDVDVATDPALLKGATAILIGGGSQYWTASLRTAIRAAQGAGTNVAFFGASTGARLVRLTDADRSLQVSQLKPSTSVRLTGLRPSCYAKVSGTDEAGSGETERPGAPDTGGSVSDGWVISNAGWWGYRGSGVKNDDILPHLVADRIDRASTTSKRSPQPMQVLSFTQTMCGATAKYVAQSGVYLIRKSGAGVFTAGTDRWACAVRDECTDGAGRPVSLDASTRRIVTRVTRNVIIAFAKSKAGKRFTAENDASQYSALR
jgi:hypothetical protein